MLLIRGLGGGAENGVAELPVHSFQLFNFFSHLYLVDLLFLQLLLELADHAVLRFVGRLRRLLGGVVRNH